LPFNKCITNKNINMSAYETAFTIISYDREKEFQHQIWKHSEDITEDEVKHEVNLNAQGTIIHGAKLLLSDTRNFTFTISPELQNWMIDNFFKLIIKAGVKKYAILVSSDLFSQVSIEQTVDENKDNSVITRYFDSEDEAKKWLFEN